MSNKRHIVRLTRRKEFLERRVQGKPASQVSFDISEIDALRWALSILEDALPDNDAHDAPSPDVA
jgi:hypothetical protein